MKHTVTRVRHVVEAMVVDAASPQEAIDKARKTKRADWAHLESKKRKGYQAVEVQSE